MMGGIPVLGAIIGDIVGSRFEFNNHRSKEFEFFTPQCFATDDSIMSLVVAKAILESDDFSQLGSKTIHYMQKIGRRYPVCGYGGSFYHCFFDEHPQPYNSYGNGAAMRVSACGFAAASLEDAKAMSKIVTEVSHNHPEGIKGAEATTIALYMARTGSSISEIKECFDQHYYPMNFTN